MKHVVLILACLSLTGCIMLPSSPVCLTSGNLDVLYGTLHVGWELTVSNPLNTNKPPVVAPAPIPAPEPAPTPTPPIRELKL